MKKEDTTIDQKEALRVLRNQWWKSSFFGCVAVLVCFFILRRIWEPRYAWQWLLEALFVWTYVLTIFRTALPLNHRPAEKALMGILGAGSCVTLARGLLISMLAGFLLLPWPGKMGGPFWLAWVPGGMYILAATADFLDGYLARITGHVTRLGETLDTKMDALGLLIAPVLAIWYGQLPIFYIAVSGAYYLFIFGIWLRQKTGKYLVELRPRPSSRLIAGFQMGFVGVALLPLFSPPVTTIAALILMTPLLLGFARDWLVVSGATETDADQRGSWENKFDTMATRWLPVFLRIIVLGAGFFLVGRSMLPDMSHWIGIQIIFFIMLVFGLMGRIAALFITFSLALTINHYGPVPELVILYACSIALMSGGTGSLSLWKPEDKILLRKAGQTS